MKVNRLSTITFSKMMSTTYYMQDTSFQKEEIILSSRSIGISKYFKVPNRLFYYYCRHVIRDVRLLRVPTQDGLYNQQYNKICCRCHILLNGPYCHACHLLPALALALAVFVVKPPGSLASISQLLVSTSGVDGESRWGSGKLAHPCA